VNILSRSRSICTRHRKSKGMPLRGSFSASCDFAAPELFLRENVSAFQVTSGSVANFARTIVSSMIASPRN
jgi:hypothetical protein